MLTESVVAKKDVVAGQVRRHAIRPVEHFHFDEDEFLAVADIDRVARFNGFEIPFLVVLAGKGLDRVFRALYRYVRYVPDKFA